MIFDCNFYASFTGVAAATAPGIPLGVVERDELYSSRRLYWLADRADGHSDIARSPPSWCVGRGNPFFPFGMRKEEVNLPRVSLPFGAILLFSPSFHWKTCPTKKPLLRVL